MKQPSRRACITEAMIFTQLSLCYSNCVNYGMANDVVSFGEQMWISHYMALSNAVIELPGELTVSGRNKRLTNGGDAFLTRHSS